MNRLVPSRREKILPPVHLFTILEQMAKPDQLGSFELMVILVKLWQGLPELQGGKA